MRPHLIALLIASALTVSGVAKASGSAGSRPAPDLLIVAPLDTAVVTVDPLVATTALADREPSTRRAAPSPALSVARAFHPRFGETVARAARRVEVIDSSAARLPLLDPDSSRFSLTVTGLAFTQSTRTVARRTVPPSPPGFDPATGEMTPGVRRAYTEGPGLVTTLTVTATWVVRDRDGDSTRAAGTTSGASEFRGDARRSDWDKAARDLALNVLRRTPFSPDAEGQRP